MVGGIHTHLDDVLASQYQSIDWTQHTTCCYSFSCMVPGAESFPQLIYTFDFPYFCQ